MGVGKTTLGRELAKLLNCEFVDLDLFIQNRYNKSIVQIFDEEGEDGFRVIENKVLSEISLFENVIISTGGGAPCFFNNMEIMNNAGITVYLRASAELLSKRLNGGKDKRPLIKDKSEEELFLFVDENIKKREPYYNQAQIIFETEELINREDVGEYASMLVNRLDRIFKK